MNNPYSVPRAGSSSSQETAPAVWSCNEWDPLVEVIVGNPRNARYPYADASSLVAEYAGKTLGDIPIGCFPDNVLEEAEEDLVQLITLLESFEIKVRRPEAWPHDAEISTPFWTTKGYYNYCPRDVMLVIGDQIIETPNIIRGRFLECYSYQEILLDYLRDGAKWFSAPKPQLKDSLFDIPHSHPVPRNDEPVFDAANVLRLGRDLVYLISSTGNELGAHWLQTILGSEFRVHVCRLDYYGSHIDTSIVALREGLLLCNPERVKIDMLPPILKEWEVVFCPPMVAPDHLNGNYLSNCIGSSWIDMNLFSIRPDLVVIDRDQLPLIRLLEKKGIDVAPMKLRHARMMGGGYHCATLDVKRKGDLVSYFSR